ncbi:hypothetical protein EON67_02135 [archaeon]|nr:MAG: hypothetical protein EON67_02135 [archaeon]
MQDLKDRGNAALASGDTRKAIECYTAALRLEPCNAVYASNRAIAHLKVANYSAALADACTAIENKRGFVKAYASKAHALCELGRWTEAVAAAQEGLEFDATNANLKSHLAYVHALPPTRVCVCVFVAPAPATLPRRPAAVRARCATLSTEPLRVFVCVCAGVRKRVSTRAQLLQARRAARVALRTPHQRRAACCPPRCWSRPSWRAALSWCWRHSRTCCRWAR